MQLQGANQVVIKTVNLLVNTMHNLFYGILVFIHVHAYVSLDIQNERFCHFMHLHTMHSDQVQTSRGPLKTQSYSNKK